MISHVATTIAFEYFDASLCELLRRSEYIPGLGVSTQRNHRRVLEQQQDIADTIFFAKVHELLLQTKARGVIDSAELEDRDHIAPGNYK